MPAFGLKLRVPNCIGPHPFNHSRAESSMRCFPGDSGRHFTAGKPATAASVGLFRHFGWPKPLATMTDAALAVGEPGLCRRCRQRSALCRI
jgi:hypothetical protein